MLEGLFLTQWRAIAAYSAGTDSLLKHFDAMTGQVVSKIAIPSTRGASDGGRSDPPTILSALTPQNLLLGCDSGALHILDLREATTPEGAKAASTNGLTGGCPSSRPAQTHFPHDDYVSSITALPQVEKGTNGQQPATGPPAIPRQFVTTGSTTLAVTDLRRGVLVRSDDQEDELLCSTFVQGMGPKKNRNNGVLLVGTGAGVLTLWDRGSWDDQQERILLGTGTDSIECVAQVPQDIVGGGAKKAVVGMGDGGLCVVDLVKREIDADGVLVHDDIESVVAVGFDCFGRMISGGGTIVKVWGVKDEQSDEDSDEDDEDDEEDEEDEDDSDSDEDAGKVLNGKRKSHADDDSDSDQDAPRRGKKRRGRGNGPHGDHGIMAFDDLD